MKSYEDNKKKEKGKGKQSAVCVGVEKSVGFYQTNLAHQTIMVEKFTNTHIRALIAPLQSLLFR